MSTHRTLCSVLEEMRKAYENRNFSYLLASIEEAQVLGNRMEAALEEKQEVEAYHEKAKEARQLFDEEFKDALLLMKESTKDEDKLEKINRLLSRYW